MAHQVPGPYGHPPVPHWHSPQGSATVTPESPKPLEHPCVLGVLFRHLSLAMSLPS